MSRRDREEMAELVERLARDRGGQVLGIRAPDAPVPALVVAAPVPAVGPGDVIVEFEVCKRPVPWKAPSTTRTGHAYKDKSLVAWQVDVKKRAKEAMRGREPYDGPVELRLLFSLIRKSGSVADLDNLNKGTIDALQGAAIVNDRKVVAMASRRTFGDRDFARIQIIALSDAG